jgi:hypothetical protein
MIRIFALRFAPTAIPDRASSAFLRDDMLRRPHVPRAHGIHFGLLVISIHAKSRKMLLEHKLPNILLRKLPVEVLKESLRIFIVSSNG